MHSRTKSRTGTVRKSRKRWTKNLQSASRRHKGATRRPSARAAEKPARVPANRPQIRPAKRGQAPPQKIALHHLRSAARLQCPQTRRTRSPHLPSAESAPGEFLDVPVGRKSPNARTTSGSTAPAQKHTPTPPQMLWLPASGLSPSTDHLVHQPLHAPHSHPPRFPRQPANSPRAKRRPRIPQIKPRQALRHIMVEQSLVTAIVNLRRKRAKVFQHLPFCRCARDASESTLIQPHRPHLQLNQRAPRVQPSHHNQSLSLRVARNVSGNQTAQPIERKARPLVRCR